MSAALTRLPVVHIDGFDYPTYRNDQGELVMQDLLIAQALQLTDPHSIRRLIVKYRSDLGEVSDHQSETPDSGGRPGIGYALTEAQALYIAAKCRTKAAAAQLKRLIAVYMAARRGDGAAAVALAAGQTAAASPGLTRADIRALIVESIANLGPAIVSQVVAQLPAHGNGLLGRTPAAEVRATIRQHADLIDGGPRTSREWNRARTKQENRLRQHVGYLRGGWDYCPVSAGVVGNGLRYLARDIESAARRRGPEQLRLVPGGGKPAAVH